MLKPYANNDKTKYTDDKIEKVVPEMALAAGGSLLCLVDQQHGRTKKREVSEDEGLLKRAGGMGNTTHTCVAIFFLLLTPDCFTFSPVLSVHSFPGEHQYTVDNTGVNTHSHR